MIQDTIDKLKTLQDVLSRKFVIEAEIKDLPKALSTKTELLNRMKKSYIEKNNQYDATKQRMTDLREKMETAERERERYEQQMDLIQTQREYEALDKEIRDASEREQSLRKELQKETKVLEEMSEELSREESLIEQQEQEVKEEQDKIKDETEAKKRNLDELEEDEKKLVPGLDEELIFKFKRIIRSKEGEGIVPLKKGVCTGCQMILPNQFVNDVQRGDQILFCPYCSKIVFYVGDEESEYSEEDSESLADVVESFGGNEDFGIEDVLDEEPLQMGDAEADEEVEEEEELEPDSDEEVEETEGEDYDEEENYDGDEERSGEEE
ncbi:MAG: nucleic acid-binding protein [Spirochaetes bacterium]|jgi:predicted  nucleic acid-binding Zn-ribbon protein|nr:nucleic acid-binding protein [Spirochaetota bacterium]